MGIRWKQAVIAGVVATAVMTAVGIFVAPMMGIPRMNPAEMLAMQMGGVLALGWAAHFMIGAILALIYTVAAPFIPGPAALRGALYALGPFLLAQLAVMPMMGMPLFSGSAVLALGSMLGHLVYGAVLGGVYGEGPARSAAAVRAVAAAPSR